MSLWRREAIERFPELRREIAESGLPDLWQELWYTMFIPAYFEKQPADTEAIGRVYNYALWCLKHPNIDVRSYAAMLFFESLPDHPRIRREMPRWIPLEDFDTLAWWWEYSTKQPFDEFRKEFLENKARIEVEAAKTYWLGGNTQARRGKTKGESGV